MRKITTLKCDYFINEKGLQKLNVMCFDAQTCGFWLWAFWICFVIFKFCKGGVIDGKKTLNRIWRLVWDKKLDGIKNLSRAWFRSTDLWVMGPARFHCATLLFLFPARQTRPHNLHLPPHPPPPPLRLRKPPDFRANSLSLIQNLDSCRKCHFWSASQNCCSFHGCFSSGAPPSAQGQVRTKLDFLLG